MPRSRWSAGALALLVAGYVHAQPNAATPQADTILINGKVITADAGDSIAEAVAIRGGKILAVGTRSAVLRSRGSGTHMVDLHGRTVTPGLIDTHIHFQAVETIYAVELSQVRSVEEVIQKVAERAAKSKPGEWISGSGWDEGKLAEHRYIYASDLDKAAPNNPVWLEHTTGHYGVGNSAALKLAHIDAATKDPPASTIDRDPEGRPTGVLKEEAATRLVTRLIPPYSHDQLRAGLLKIIADVNREGMTAVKNPGIGPREWDLYRELRDQDKISVHLFALWSGGRSLDSTRAAVARVQALPKPTSQLADDVLISGGVKLFLDGSGGARTAWMFDDWNKNFTDTDTGNRGYPTTDPEVYRAQIHLIHNAGIHVSTHAIGDRAIDWAVDSYAEALKEKPTAGLRHGVIHANVPTEHALSVMTALQKQYDAGYPEVQPGFTWWIGDTYAGNFGPARALRLVPLQTFLTRGIKWAGGSDYPVTPFPARYGIWASVVRKTLRGSYGAQPFGTKEAVDVHIALRSYTLWAARQLFLEKQIGSIEPGKDADLAVWDRDFYGIPADAIQDAKCELTLFQGRIVYRDTNSPVTVE
ncbi:MAG: amidohydrolase family protein [Acidobacteriia bacterium]|nr:amidohydrolase family protein [Terriglobia bacterium]